MKVSKIGIVGPGRRMLPPACSHGTSSRLGTRGGGPALPAADQKRHLPGLMRMGRLGDKAPSYDGLRVCERTLETVFDGLSSRDGFPP